jgi:hypothetical protein
VLTLSETYLSSPLAGEERGLIPFGNFLNDFRVQATQNPRGFLDSALPDYLQQNAVLLMERQRLQRP